MSTSTTPTLDGLAALERAYAKARDQARQVAADADTARRTLAAATEDLVRAFDAGDQAAAKKAELARAKAQAVAGEPWNERVQGAKRAAERAKGDLESYQRTNVYRLIAELRPAALEAAAAVDEAVDRFEDAVLAWAAASNRANRISVAAGRPDRRAPITDGLTNLVRDIKRRGATPIPLPDGPKTVVLHPDPNQPAHGFVDIAL
jgi:hypothetical protein